MRRTLYRQPRSELDITASSRYIMGMIEAMTSAYMGMQQAQLQQDAGTAVLKDSIDQAAQQGTETVGLIESAGGGSTNATDAQIQEGLAMTDPDLAQNVDLLA